MSKTQKEPESQPIESLGSEYDFNKPDYSFIPAGVHEWRQQGYYLICKSCEIEHAVHIGPNKLLVGFDNNQKPILKKR